MSFDGEKLFALLPALHRIRDIEYARATPDLLTAAERAELAALEGAGILTADQQQQLTALRDKHDRGPLRSVLMVLAEEIAAIEEDLEQLYDDQFIETCADWAVPYVGDLIGYRPLFAVTPKVASARAEVAHTIALRRRKGTAAMLEQLARDVTGWNARAVEFFQLLATTQYMNHARPHNLYAPNLRRWEPLEHVGSAFDAVAHTVDVRRAASSRGRYNIPNVGLFLWRLGVHSVTRSPAVRVDDRRYRVSPLGYDLPLFNRADSEDEITHIAERVNVAAPLSRRLLHERLATYYGAGRSLQLIVNGAAIPAGAIRICDLSGDDPAWAHLPPDGQYAIDPVLGRVALPGDLAFPVTVETSFHYGFSADLGGGEYERGDSFAAPPGQNVVRVPDDQPTIQLALDALSGSGVVEITDNGRYAEAPVVRAAAGGHIELRAAPGRRPTLALTGELGIRGGDDSEVALNGLLIVGNRLVVPAAPDNRLKRLRLRHLTLVPGRSLTPNGLPAQPGEPSLVVEIDNLAVEISGCIVGGLRVPARASVRAADTILDANAPTGVAYAAPDALGAGGELTLHAVTAIGKVHATVLREVSNCILLAELAAADPWPAPVQALRRQEGCVRFSYLPLAARVPRRYRCQPGEGATAPVAPRFTSLRYGVAAYCQLNVGTPDLIRRGADDEGEMGAFHHLYQPQRETNLRIRLAEYLRAGLEAGIFYET